MQYIVKFSSMMLSVIWLNLNTLFVRAHLTINQHWFRYWLTAKQVQASTWTKVGLDLWCHMASRATMSIILIETWNGWVIFPQILFLTLILFRLRMIFFSEHALQQCVLRHLASDSFALGHSQHTFWQNRYLSVLNHYKIMTWKICPHHWPFVSGSHWSLVT